MDEKNCYNFTVAIGLAGVIPSTGGITYEMRTAHRT
jgi:hypothetical protein